MLINNLNVTDIVGKQARDQFGDTTRYAMAQAMVEAWRAGECKLVLQTLLGAGDLTMRTRWKDDMIKLLLPTERPYFIKRMGEICKY